MRIRLYQPGRVTNGGLDLIRNLGGKGLKLTKSKFRARGDDVILNWGSTTMPDNLLNARVFNHPNLVKKAVDKLVFFNLMADAGVRVPEFTTSFDEARLMCAQGAVVERHMLRASAGRGVRIAESPGDVTRAPLYTQYIKKQDEFRVHVVNGEIIDYQRKKRVYDVPDEDVNWQVRTMANGFTFGRDNVEINEDVRRQSQAAILALGLDWGAVDVVWNQSQGMAYVLEVNTAPGLVATTLERYTNSISNML